MVNGKRVPAYNSNVRVFGQFYPMDVMKSFFAQHNMNFTNDYENTDISSIFNGDLNNDCAQFDRVQNTSTLKSCMLNDPYGGGLAAPNNTCLSLRQLQSFYKSKMGILGFAWEDMDLKSISGHGLTLVGDSGSIKMFLFFLPLFT
jgi:chitin synthase